MALDPKIVDPEFVAKWVENEEGVNQSWAIYAMEKNWDDRYIPILRKVLFNNKPFSEAARANAASVLGTHKVAEAVPDLEKALLDNDSGVRSGALGALKNILGIDEVMRRYRNPKYIHPDDLDLYPDLKEIKK
jgi:hypothetical protein